MSLLEKALQLLEAKSKKAIELAKIEMLSVNVKDKKLREALEYYACNLDDSLHPGIIALAYESVGMHVGIPVEIQLAMLFLTSAIDIHDDVIDESLTKNGRPTIFGKFGRDIALLVGDGMFLKGMSILHNCKEIVPYRRIDAIISTVLSSFFEAGDAHVTEVFLRIRGNVSPRRYYNILNKKAAILECHTRIGAIAGGASFSQIGMLGKYGRLIGLLILLRDEFIDIFEPEELIARIKKGYPPLPVLYSLKNPKIGKFVKEIMSQPKSVKEEELATFIDTIFEDASVAIFRKRMEKLVEEALNSINNIPRNEELKLIALSTMEGLR